jgi:anaerobic selenocysteine-containing dehydrogenase
VGFHVEAEFFLTLTADLADIVLPCGVQPCATSGPSCLEKANPDPYLEINTEKAKDLDLRDRDCVIVESPFGGITLRTRLTEGIAYDIICMQNWWWQACHALGLAGYDPYSLKGANVNLLYQTDEIDRISGSLPIKGYPDNVRKV